VVRRYSSAVPITPSDGKLPKPPGVREVSARAGVSRSTAARALSGEGYVSDAIRARVLQAAEELGYRPNEIARALSGSQSRIVGVLLADISNAFYAEVATGIEQVLSTSDYLMLLATSTGHVEREIRGIQTFQATRAAGMLITPVGRGRSTSHELNRLAVPIVEIDHRSAGARNDVVLLDNVHATDLATSHLLELGHRRIGLLCGADSWTSGRERYKGYVRALERHHVLLDETLIVRCEYDLAAATQASAQLMRRGEFTGLVTTNEVLTYGAFLAAAEFGRRIPTDLSLVGFDDVAWMRTAVPSITTVSQPTFDIGRTAANVMLDRLRGVENAKRTHRLAPNLLVRASTMPV